MTRIFADQESAEIRVIRGPKKDSLDARSLPRPFGGIPRLSRFFAVFRYVSLSHPWAVCVADHRTKTVNCWPEPYRVKGFLDIDRAAQWHGPSPVRERPR